MVFNKVGFLTISRLYVALPIANNPEYMFDASEAQRSLESWGYKVINPCKNVFHRDEKNWTQCMKEDIIAIIQHAQGIAALEGWENSRGARLEVDIATKLVMPVFTLEQWGFIANNLDYRIPVEFDDGGAVSLIRKLKGSLFDED